METIKNRVLVETSYSDEIKSLILTKKDSLPQDNPFFFQILILLGGFIRITSRLASGDLVTKDMSRKELQLLQDNIRDTIDGVHKTKIIMFGNERIILLHLQDESLGCAIGDSKYIFDSQDAELLREFCAKLM